MADILLTLPVALLFLLIALRCLQEMGRPDGLSTRIFPTRIFPTRNLGLKEPEPSRPAADAPEGRKGAKAFRKGNKELAHSPSGAGDKPSRKAGEAVRPQGASLAADSKLPGAEGAGRFFAENAGVIKVFFFALSLRAMMLLALVLCAGLLCGDDGLSPGEITGRFYLWDARHYVNLIEQGYTAYQEDGRHIFLVFYPLYVWVARLVRLVVPNTVAAGVLVSVASFAGGCCWVYKLAEELFGRQVAWNAVLFLSVFPFSIFFGTVMTEGLFLLTTSAACYYAVKRRWLFFGIWGALAALTRMTGVLVIVPAALALLEEAKPLAKPVGQSLKAAALKLLKALPMLLMPLLGSAGYLALNWHVDGDPFAFAGHQEHWHQGGMWISGVLRYLGGYSVHRIHDPLTWAVWIPELLLFIVFFVTLALSAWRGRMPGGLLAYGFCYLVANYSLSWLLSSGRYLSCGFPFFIMAAELTEHRPGLRSWLLAVSAALMGICLFEYLNYGPIM